MEKRKVSSGIAALLAVLIAVQIWVIAGFGARKDGFDIDELFTYGLANSYGEPFISPREGEWTSGERFMAYLTVDGHAHEYLNVYDNQIADVHPPLYYLFIHAVCSVFRAAGLSKWTSIGVNLICFAVTQIALFFLACRVLTGSWRPAFIALLPVAVYGFGAGAITGAVFIRMYAMMTMWAVLLSLSLVWLWQEGLTPARLLALKAALIGGFLTQYYFTMLAGLLCGALFFALLASRRAKEAGRLVAHCFLALALGIAMFPWCMAHIFGGYRGLGAFEQASSLSFDDLRRWCGILFDVINRQQFAGFLPWLAAAALALTAIALPLRRARAPQMRGAGLALVGLFAAMTYIALVAAVSPYKVDRYILCVYPLAVLGVFALLARALGALGPRRGGALLSAALLLALGALSVKDGQVHYLFEGRDECVRVCEAHADLPCVLLGSNDMTENLLELAAFEHVLVLSKDDGGQVAQKLDELDAYDPERGFVLLQRYEDEEALARIVEAAGASGALPLYTHQLTAYLVR